jgi:hypothetical protein
LLAAWREGSHIGLETATYIDALVTSNPDGADARSTADDHLRLIKAALKRSFPMVGGAVSASAAAISYVNDLTASAQAQITTLAIGTGVLNASHAVSASDALALGGVAAAGFPQLAGFNIFTYPSQLRRAASAYEYFQSTDAPTLEQSWLVNYASSAGILYGATTGDSLTYGSTFMAVTRNGLAPENVLFYGSGSFYWNSQDLANPVQMNGIGYGSWARRDAAQTFEGGQGSTPVALAYTATVTPTANSGNVFRVTLTGNVTFVAPSSPRPGQVIVLIVQQDATGSRTASWSSSYKFPSGAAPTLTTTANAKDVFSFVYDSTDGVWLQAGLNVS